MELLIATLCCGGADKVKQAAMSELKDARRNLNIQLVQRACVVMTILSSECCTLVAAIPVPTAFPRVEIARTKEHFERRRGTKGTSAQLRPEAHTPPTKARRTDSEL